MNWGMDCEPIRSFVPFTGYRVEAVRGEGIVGDPVRITTSWFTEDGDLIAYIDSWDEQRERDNA
jgi:hypothetical protein